MLEDEKILTSGYEIDQLFREEIEKRMREDEPFRFAVYREFEKFTGQQAGFKVMRLTRKEIIAWAARWFEAIDGSGQPRANFALNARDLLHLRAIYILAENHCPDTIAVPIFLNGLVTPAVIFEAISEPQKRIFLAKVKRLP